MSAAVLKEMEEHMSKSIEVLRTKLSKVRTGRASIAMLDDIKVEAYGSEMPLNQVATLGVPEPRTITIQPWDKNVVQAIEKAILKSPLGLTPNTQSDIIRINIPALTEERRKEYSKLARSLGEETKVAIRNIRRDANTELDKLKKSGDLPEDDHHKAQGRVQEKTDEFTKHVDEMVSKKEEEIMEV